MSSARLYQKESEQWSDGNGRWILGIKKILKTWKPLKLAAGERRLPELMKTSARERKRRIQSGSWGNKKAGSGVVLLISLLPTNKMFSCIRLGTRMVILYLLKTSRTLSRIFNWALNGFYSFVFLEVSQWVLICTKAIALFLLWIKLCWCQTDGISTVFWHQFGIIILKWKE